MKKTLFILTLLFVFCSAVFSCATIQFFDDFEYNDSPSNHGWYTRSENFYTTKEVANKGDRSLKGHIKPNENGRIFLYYKFNENEFGDPIKPTDKISLKVSFYDKYSIPNKITRSLKRNFGGLYRKLFEKNGETNFKTSQFGIHFDYFNKYHKGISISSSERDYSYSKDIGWETIKPRKTGWHEIEVLIEQNMMSIYFDGEMVGKDIGKVDKLLSFQWSSASVFGGVEVYSWIDDVRFVRKSIK